MEAVVFVGIQGSGKSSLFRDCFADTHVRINLDMLRTRRRESLLVSACLEAQQRFVVDNTNATAADRARYIGPARAAGFRVVGFYFDAPVELALRRNARRAGKARIPDAGVRGTHQRLEPPSRTEGFDELYRVQLLPGGGFLLTE